MVLDVTKLIEKRWVTSVQQCRSFQGVDMESDHSLVMANNMLKLKKNIRGPYIKIYDLERLQNEVLRQNFAIKVRQLLNSIVEIGADQLAKVVNEAVSEIISE